jgi:hypothetical protein
MRIFKVIIFPVCLYGCETWYLTLRKYYRLKVFDKRALRIISGQKKGETISLEKIAQ